MKKTIRIIQNKKQKREKIVALTAYDYGTARIMDTEGIDLILVGDSVAMVYAGHETTLAATMDMMVYHSDSVSRAVTDALVVADMPFLSYHTGVTDTIRNAGRLLTEGHATAVKMEGGNARKETLQAVVDADIPVLGHIGLLPQGVHRIGGYRVYGKSVEEEDALLADADAVEAAGCFAVVLECVVPRVAKKISERLTIPTVGIGSGRHCDGQILVMHDIVGLTVGVPPSFAKQYTDMRAAYAGAFRAYCEDVRCGQFPADTQDS